ncbi:uncharacterized protein F4812DRAFT_437790 [Daldinia caldariorum]|uniref:uncharacterized protein n=1 Tax=Daldinia caldariorum TaxID=326644 RepID=UPI00200827B8|nr:uncharacterized protein F4812DRAFT_437790 [Daldinia caldariorum]KAI1465843.1 hypothetical protein F4812DRAFT_437790 [Daldinia caldariorum]
MSPSQPTTETTNNQTTQSSGPAAHQPVHTTQPVALQAMDPQRPQPEQPEYGTMRGGERSSCCPGRFCFCIPCPLPCDFCII